MAAKLAFNVHAANRSTSSASAAAFRASSVAPARHSIRRCGFRVGHGLQAKSATLSTRSRDLARPSIPAIAPRQHFGSAAARSRAIVNPRQDEHGNEMEVEITPRASERLKQIMANESNPDLALRVTVESGGCHGFQYLMSLTNMSDVSKEEDTVFAAEDEGPGSGQEERVAKVVMDEPSLELLKGSRVDYTMELIGSQFKIVDNPLATSSCGCGTSFDIKA